MLGSVAKAGQAFPSSVPVDLGDSTALAGAEGLPANPLRSAKTQRLAGHAGMRSLGLKDLVWGRGSQAPSHWSEREEVGVHLSVLDLQRRGEERSCQRSNYKAQQLRARRGLIKALLKLTHSFLEPVQDKRALKR